MMSYFSLNSPQLFLTITALFAEGTAFMFYKRFKLKARRLHGTGRVADIDVANNWQSLFRVALVAIPVLLYILR